MVYAPLTRSRIFNLEGAFSPPHPIASRETGQADDRRRPESGVKVVSEIQGKGIRRTSAEFGCSCHEMEHCLIQSMMACYVSRRQSCPERENPCLATTSAASYFQLGGAVSQNFFLPNPFKHSTLFRFGQFTSMGRPIIMRSEGAKTSGGGTGGNLNNLFLPFAAVTQGPFLKTACRRPFGAMYCCAVRR